MIIGKALNQSMYNLLNLFSVMEKIVEALDNLQSKIVTNINVFKHFAIRETIEPGYEYFCLL